MPDCYKAEALPKIWKKTVKEFAKTLNPPRAFISKLDLAILLLVHYNWDEDKINEELMDSADNVYAQIGLSLDEKTVEACCVCQKLAEHPACGHTCDTDLKAYLSSEVKAGKAKLRCANHSMCHVNHLRLVLDKDDKEKFYENLGRSMVHGKLSYTLCLCGSIIKLRTDEKETDFISCVGCSLRYCFKCKILHFPATCEENEKWIARLFGDGIKPCPKCKVRTQKTEGCLHMTCKVSGCSHEYCWLCLKNWSDKHGFYVCKSEEDFGGTDANLVRCEKELRKISVFRERLHQFVTGGNAEETALLRSRLFSEDALIKNHSQMIELYEIIKWSAIHFCYNPDSRVSNLADDLRRLFRCFKENMDEFPDLGNWPVTYSKEVVEARTASAKNLITELISKHHAARH